MKKRNLIMIAGLITSFCASYAYGESNPTVKDAATLNLLNKQVATELSSKVIKVYDGDTFTIEAKDPLTNKNYRVRIRDIDTPEKGWRAKCEAEKSAAEVAQKYLNDLIYGKNVALTHFGQDKYGRLLADVKIGNIEIKNYLIEHKVARSYTIHEQKPNWCQLLPLSK